MSILKPFGFFRDTPFGWEDCPENAEGAKPLYEISADDALKALGWFARMEKAEAKVAEQYSILRQLHDANLSGDKLELAQAFDALMMHIHSQG